MKIEGFYFNLLITKVGISSIKMQHHQPFSFNSDAIQRFSSLLIHERYLKMHLAKQCSECNFRLNSLRSLQPGKTDKTIVTTLEASAIIFNKPLEFLIYQDTSGMLQMQFESNKNLV